MYYDIREISSGNMIYFLFASSVHYLSALLGRHYGFACWAPVLYTMGLVSQRSSSINSMVYTFVINILDLNLSSIFNSLNAVTTEYGFLANKNTKFWKLTLLIFLRFSQDFDDLSLIFL